MPGSGELAPAAAEARVRQAETPGDRVSSPARIRGAEAGPQLARSAAMPGRGAAVALRVDRPAVRLVAAHELPARSAALARSEARRPREEAAAWARPAATSGARLAAATGAELMQGEEGYETVLFPRPAGLAFAPAVSLMRAADGEREPAAASDAPAATESAPAPAAQGGGGGGGDIEEIYTQVIERLRRDLLADRERMGDLLGDLP